MGNLDLEVPILLVIKLGIDKQFTCFDWKNNKKNDEIVAGDILGNIYWIKVHYIPEKNIAQYEIMSVLCEAHKNMITEIEFYPNNNDSSALFASTSINGELKIFDFIQGKTPLLELDIFSVLIYFIFFYCYFPLSLFYHQETAHNT